MSRDDKFRVPDRRTRAVSRWHRSHGREEKCSSLGAAIDAIGGRWKLAVLCTLFGKGPQRYNALLRSLDGISSKELTRNLRELESAGLVVAVASDGHSQYALTDLGLEIETPFSALQSFGTALSHRLSNRTSPIDPR